MDKVDYVPLTQTIGLDSLINKKLIAANNISRFIHKSDVIVIATLEGIDADVLEFQAQPNSAITKNQISEIDFPKGSIVGGFIRGDQVFIATGESKINSGDKVVIFSLPDTVNKLEKLFER